MFESEQVSSAGSQAPRIARLMQRKLAAIFAADVVGYSRLVTEDEAGTLEALRARRKNVLEPLVAQAPRPHFQADGRWRLRRVRERGQCRRMRRRTAERDGREQCRRLPGSAAASARRHQPRRSGRRRRRSLRRRRQPGDAAAGDWPSPAASAFRPRCMPKSPQARLCLRRSGRAHAQEHRRAGAGVPHRRRTRGCARAVGRARRCRPSPRSSCCRSST